jgi:hypothetical protein
MPRQPRASTTESSTWPTGSAIKALPLLISYRARRMSVFLTALPWFAGALLVGSVSLASLDHSGAAPAPGSLTGRWHAQFRLTTASRLPFPILRRKLSGEMRFAPAAPPPLPQDAPTWRWVHQGEVVVDFQPFGFVLGGTETLGWYESPDTVRIILDPNVDHGNVELVGSGTATELGGRWQLVSDLARAEGEFTLRRLD